VPAFSCATASPVLDFGEELVNLRGEQHRINSTPVVHALRQKSLN
jgi:hypothetical protein